MRDVLVFRRLCESYTFSRPVFIVDRSRRIYFRGILQLRASNGFVLPAIPSPNCFLPCSHCTAASFSIASSPLATHYSSSPNHSPRSSLSHPFSSHSNTLSSTSSPTASTPTKLPTILVNPSLTSTPSSADCSRNVRSCKRVDRPASSGAESQTALKWVMATRERARKRGGSVKWVVRRWRWSCCDVGEVETREERSVEPREMSCGAKVSLTLPNWGENEQLRGSLTSLGPLLLRPPSTLRRTAEGPPRPATPPRVAAPLARSFLH